MNDFGGDHVLVLVQFEVLDADTTEDFLALLLSLLAPGNVRVHLCHEVLEALVEEDLGDEEEEG